MIGCCALAKRRLEVYKKAAEKAGFKILDIYRGKDEELVRFMYKGKVMCVKIKGYRENMTPEEFVEKLRSAIK